MNTSNPTKYWALLIIRGLLYMLIGVSMLFVINALTPASVLLVGGLFIAAGVCGGAYALSTLRTDRNYIWELLRSLFDIGFGIAFLIYANGQQDRFLESFGFWAVLYASVHAVQAMYVAMLSGGKQPRNVSGNLLHFLNVLLTLALAYVLLTPARENIPSVLGGVLVILLGLIILLLAVQQRQTLLNQSRHA